MFTFTVYKILGEVSVLSSSSVIMLSLSLSVGVSVSVSVYTSVT